MGVWGAVCACACGRGRVCACARVGAGVGVGLGVGSWFLFTVFFCIFGFLFFLGFCCF